MAIKEDIGRILNGNDTEADERNLADFLGDGMYIEVRILANNDGDIEVEELTAGEVSNLPG